MEVRSALVKMVNAIDGKWVVAAAHLGMTENALKNRVYETKGQSLSTSDAMLLQELSGASHFAEAIAHASGGTFAKLPDIGQVDNDSVHAVFNELHVEFAEHFKQFMDAINDGQIDSGERKSLEEHGATVHRTFDKLQALMFAVYCPRTNVVKLPQAKEEVTNG
jgi:hypothetical protein